MMYANIKLDLIFRALLCTLVGLLHVEDMEVVDEFQVIEKLSTNHKVIAHGVIASIDTKNKLFHIATPVDNVDAVNCISRGKLRVPTELTFQASAIQTTPYLMG